MKKKRKIQPVDQLAYMKERGEKYAGEINFKTSSDQYLMMDIRNFYTYFDSEEAYQMLKALHKAATVQFGEEFHSRVQRYLDQVKVIS